MVFKTQGAKMPYPTTPFNLNKFARGSWFLFKDRHFLPKSVPQGQLNRKKNLSSFLTWVFTPALRCN